MWSWIHNPTNKKEIETDVEPTSSVAKPTVTASPDTTPE